MKTTVLSVRHPEKVQSIFLAKDGRLTLSQHFGRTVPITDAWAQKLIETWDEACSEGRSKLLEINEAAVSELHPSYSCRA